MNKWIVTTGEKFSGEFNYSFRGDFFSVFSEKEPERFQHEGVKLELIFDGYVLPAINNNSHQELSSSELIKKSLDTYKEDFINHIKGTFIILLFSNNSCSIYSDQLGLKKAFYTDDKSDVIFSNNIWEIRKMVKTGFSPENIAINSLFNHYAEGKTIFQNINYTLRATKYLLKPKGLEKQSYFSILDFFKSEKKQISTAVFAEKFQKIVNQYVDLLNLKTPAVTLTGGFDSRIMLAALLNKGVKPVVFNYGSPKSKDVVIADQISKKFGLTFFNNKLDNPSAEWFNKMAEEIVDKGQAITQIHRAHRLDTIINLMENNKVDAVFGGYMGGEGILGIYYDDLITSEFMRRKWVGNENDEDLIPDIFNKKFIESDKIIKEKSQLFVQSLPYFSNDAHLNHFLFSYMLKGEVHHIQDVNLFSHYVPYSIPIYLDLDYLELLFSSKFNFIFKNNDSRNPLTRINFYRFYAEMIRNLYPSLGSLPLAKQGYYTPDEYLSNKLVYIVKRLVRHFMTEKKYSPNFQLGQWMNDFVEQSIPAISESEISSLIDIESYKSSLRATTSQDNKEVYWQKFTDIIMADKILRHNK